MFAQTSKNSRTRPIIAALFVAASLILGGGGSSAPGSELVLELAAVLAAIAWLLARKGTRNPSRWPDWRITVLALIAIGLPALQLIPLPPAIWQALPGRDAEKSALELIGAGSAWMPWTMTPARTFASLLAIFPPLLAMIMISWLEYRDRNLAIWAVALITVASILLGALQLIPRLADPDP